MAKKSDPIDKLHDHTTDDVNLARRMTVGFLGTLGVSSLLGGTTLQTLNHTVLQGCEDKGLRRCKSLTDASVPATHTVIPGEAVAIGAGAALTSGALSMAGTRRDFAAVAGAAVATYPASTFLGKWLGNQVVAEAVAARDFRRRHFPLESSVIDGEDPAIARSTKPAAPIASPSQDKSETSYRDLERSRDRVGERRR